MANIGLPQNALSLIYKHILELSTIQTCHPLLRLQPINLEVRSCCDFELAKDLSQCVDVIERVDSLY